MFVRPDVKCVGNDSAFLQLLLVTIYFSGPAPQHLIHEQIVSVAFSLCHSVLICSFQKPIKNTVSIAEEYNKFMALLPHPLQYCTGSDDVSMGTCTQDFTILFLPLPCMFDCTNPQHWDMLSKEIECWLVDKVHNSSLLIWMWGWDAFWLVFIGTHLRFPNGRWSAWDPRIPLEGTFIEEWLGGDKMESVCLDGLSNSNENDDCHDTGSVVAPLGSSITLSYIWDAFSQHIALFYPQPLISAV
ncbi:hypothetical protein EDD16DRAFT_1494880 [Pisolithus croceorrhizus]|nr:hypothetical protein EDD16DRAFT_1494880 [Pisolithus croceorrhizus]KAI6116974.1 hypothetical protein EV401DRAFT_1864310 [Pisolithus croceorrhizus]KAI6162819.1 hypothetical protein EDD17DRAFT_1477590 [Pisolithus thermaeus]